MKIDAGHFYISDRAKLATNLLRYSILLCLSIAGFEVQSQSSRPFTILTSEEIIDEGVASTDSIQRVIIPGHIDSFRELGYLLADIEKAKTIQDTAVYVLYLGSQYSFTFIDWEKFPMNYINLAGVRTRKKKYSPVSVNKEIRRILNYAEENGFPFAQIKIDSISYSQEQLRLQLMLDLGPRITFDSIQVKGLKKTKVRYLENHLGVHPGELYQHSRIDQIENNLASLNFISVNEPPSILYVNNKSKITLDLKEEKVNSFDGVIGFLQNEGDEKLTITGIVDLELYNLFGSGKSLELHWQQQRELSQSLDLSYSHPQLFKSALGLKFDYNQLKEDTTFINRNIAVGLTLPWKRIRYNFGYNRSTGRILAGSLNDPSSPDIADFNIDNYRLQVEAGRFINLLNQKQWQINLGITVGDKKVLMNPLISEEYYNEIDLRTTQYRVSINGKWSLPIGEMFSLYQHLSGQTVINDQLFLNDLFRFGGLNSLRGFNELEFFANQYALSNIEFRWFWNDTSYFFGFYDQAIYALDVANIELYDCPLGIGVGVSLTTANGVFRLVYGLGKSEEQTISLNQAKIHFGFTSRF